MSENEIKPVAWVERNENGHDRMWSSTLESWANRPENPEPLYDQAAIDRLSADAVGYKRIADEVAGMLESAEDLIDRLTAEMDRMRIVKSQDGDHVSFCHAEIDRLTAELTLATGERNRVQLKWDAFRQSKNSEVQRLAAERDAAVADAASLRERMLALEAQRDEFGSREWKAEKSRRKAVAAVNIAYRHLDVKSLRVSHCKDLAAIDAARSEVK